MAELQKEPLIETRNAPCELGVYQDLDESYHGLVKAFPLFGSWRAPKLRCRQLKRKFCKSKLSFGLQHKSTSKLLNGVQDSMLV